MLATDIPTFINQIVSEHKAITGTSVQIMPSALIALCQYSWQGNIHELTYLLNQLLLLYPNGQVDLFDLPAKFHELSACALTFAAPALTSAAHTLISAAPAPTKQPIKQSAQTSIDNLPAQPWSIDLKQYLLDLEQHYIERALHQAEGVVSHAAIKLGLRRTTLLEKMRRYGIRAPKERAACID